MRTTRRLIYFLEPNNGQFTGPPTVCARGLPQPSIKPERSAPLVEIARPALPSLLLATLRRFDSLHAAPNSTGTFKCIAMFETAPDAGEVVKLTPH